MQFIMKIFGWPLGFVMLGCYLVTGNNYALAIVLFTIVTRLICLPLSIKQQKEQAKMALFKPKLDSIQKKYANNREKYNEEVQKLYTEEGYNPMSGCLPTLIQFPILFGVIDVVYRPIYHVLRVGTNVINEMIAAANAAGAAIQTSSYYSEIELMKEVKAQPELFSAFDSAVVEKIQNFDMTFFGLDLSVQPKFALTYDGGFNWYLLIPVACLVFQLVQTIYMQKKNPTQQEAGAGMNLMFYVMPLFSAYICFIVPAGAGFYWAISAIVMLLQSIFLNKKYNPQKMAEQVQAEMEAEKEKKRQQRVEARERLKELQQQKNGVKAESKYDGEELSAGQKEENRRKLAAARKRDAEKYGEQYVEVTDDDLK